MSPPSISGESTNFGSCPKFLLPEIDDHNELSLNVLKSETNKIISRVFNGQRTFDSICLDEICMKFHEVVHS